MAHLTLAHTVLFGTCHQFCIIRNIVFIHIMPKRIDSTTSEKAIFAQGWLCPPDRREKLQNSRKMTSDKVEELYLMCFVIKFRLDMMYLVLSFLIYIESFSLCLWTIHLDIVTIQLSAENTTFNIIHTHTAMISSRLEPSVPHLGSW